MCQPSSNSAPLLNLQIQYHCWEIKGQEKYQVATEADASQIKVGSACLWLRGSPTAGTLWLVLGLLAVSEGAVISIEEQTKTPVPSLNKACDRSSCCWGQEDSKENQESEKSQAVWLHSSAVHPVATASQQGEGGGMCKDASPKGRIRADSSSCLTPTLSKQLWSSGKWPWWISILISRH